jgi:hypothetical protein
MPDLPNEPDHRRARSRLAFGLVLLLVGGIMLASNLGYVVPRDLWSYWPWVLVALGCLQFVWPGNMRDRLGGFWLLIVGAWGLINTYELFGLTWGTSWPIFVIAAGLRVVLGNAFRQR